MRRRLTGLRLHFTCVVSHSMSLAKDLLANSRRALSASHCGMNVAQDQAHVSTPSRNIIAVRDATISPSSNHPSGNLDLQGASQFEPEPDYLRVGTIFLYSYA